MLANRVVPRFYKREIVPSFCRIDRNWGFLVFEKLEIAKGNSYTHIVGNAVATEDGTANNRNATLQRTALQRRNYV